ncbi:MAG: type II toxin-antitoxin system MqsA family antitoxin [Caldilineaceae bacterium]|nr:type II toxin-antitoxin system MqsA family antitoxin [Caldilineaceae bacterium]
MTENMNSTTICDVCGKGGAKIRLVSRSYGRGETLFVIENIPLVSCPHCGESYFTADTLHEIERIKLHRQLLAEQRYVPVAVFA